MARPVDEAKRLEIATAALAVLRERGVLATRMSHIADALGMKRPTLYWYFSSIPELFDYAVAHFREQEAEYIGSRLAGAGHPIDALYTCMTSAVAFYRIGGLEDFVFLICQGWAAGDATERDRFSSVAIQQLGPLRTLLIQLVEMGVALGQVKPVEAEPLIDLALSILHGAIVHEVLTGVPAEPTIAFFHHQVLAPLKGASESP